MGTHHSAGGTGSTSLAGFAGLTLKSREQDETPDGTPTRARARRLRRMPSSGGDTSPEPPLLGCPLHRSHVPTHEHHPGWGQRLVGSRPSPTRTPAPPREAAPIRTHRSTFGTGETHHASLTSGSRGAGGAGASILTSGTLFWGGESTPLAEPVARQARSGASAGTTYGGASLAIGTGAPRASSQTLQGRRRWVRSSGLQEMLQHPGKRRGDTAAGIHPQSRATSAVTVLTWLSLLQPTMPTMPTMPTKLCSPWHRGGRVPRGVQIHQEILWGQRGRGSHARQGDPGEGWERGQRLPQLQDITRGWGPEPCHRRWQQCRASLATVWVTNAVSPPPR